jgi:hypothetical protein
MRHDRRPVTDSRSSDSIALLAVNWLSTFLVQVPLHARLGTGFDAAAHRRLVLSNSLRTLAWTGRGVLALVMLRAV